MGICMESEAETVAASAIAENVERRRARDGRFDTGGRCEVVSFDDVDMYDLERRSAPPAKSPSSSLLDDRYFESQLGSHSCRVGVGDPD